MTAGPWKPFQLVPDDVLFFRDGKPSSLGDDHYLRSLFPPLPSTLYGALRTRRLLDEGVPLGGLDEAAWDRWVQGDLRAELGAWGRFGTLELRGPWLVRGTGVLLPAPLDLGVLVKEGQRPDEPPRVVRVVRYRLIEEESQGRWSHPLGVAAPFERTGGRWKEWGLDPDAEEPSPAAGWYLDAPGIERWARGGVPEPDHFVHASELWADELRTGVGLEDARRLSAKGRLYTFGFIRLRPDVALGFEVRGTELEAGGGVRLGGEGRTARLEPGPPLRLPEPRLPATEGRFRLCFLTPALSARGAYPPAALDSGHRLLTAFCRGPLAAGGWDIARGQPKPLRRAIPAGAVYLFETGAGAPPEELHGKCHNDFPEESPARQGYGLALVAQDVQESAEHGQQDL